MVANGNINNTLKNPEFCKIVLQMLIYNYFGHSFNLVLRMRLRINSYDLFHSLIRLPYHNLPSLV